MKTTSLLATWLHEAREGLFDTVIALQQKNFYNTVYHWQHFLWTVHTVARLFEPDLISWSPRITQTYARILRLLSGFPSEWSSIWLQLLLLALLLVGTGALLLYVAVEKGQNNFISRTHQAATRLALGSVLVFQVPILRTLFHLIMAESQSMAIQVVTSLLLLYALPLMYLVSCMHINDPKSYSFLARPHARYELCFLVSNLVQSLVFEIPGVPTQALVLLFFFANTSLLIGLVVFQPFYWANFNHFVASLKCFCTWSASCAIVVVFSGTRHSDMLSVVYAIGVIPSLLCGSYASYRMLLHHVRNGLKTSINSRFCDPKVFRLAMLSSFEHGVVASVRAVLHCMIAEVQTRFLLIELFPKGKRARGETEFQEFRRLSMTRAAMPENDDQDYWAIQSSTGEHGDTLQELSDNLAGGPTSTGVGQANILSLLLHPSAQKTGDIDNFIRDVSPTTGLDVEGMQLAAKLGHSLPLKTTASTIPSENEVLRARTILMRALLRHPQCLFIRTALMSFMLSFDKMDLKDCSIMQKSLEELPYDPDLRFSLVRIRYDIDDAVKNQGEQMSSIKNEEVKRIEKRAREAHFLASQLEQNVWHSLAEGSATLRNAASTIEALYHAEEEAAYAYNYLLARDPNDMSTLKNFSRFLRDVKRDKNSADAVLDQLDMLQAGSGKGAEGRSQHSGANRSSRMGTSEHGSSIGGLSGLNGASGSKFRSKEMEERRAMRVRKVSIQLRTVTALFTIVAITQFVTYIYLADVYRTKMLSINSGSERSQTAIEILATSRRMLNEAVLGHAAEFEVQRSSLMVKVEMLNRQHNDVSLRLLPDYENHIRWMEWAGSLAIDLASPSESAANGSNPIRVSGYNAVAMLVQKAAQVTNLTMAQFQDFRSGGFKPSSLPALYFILRNAFRIARAVDTSTVLYQEEAAAYSTTIMVLIISCSVLVLLFELIAVVFVFRPAISKVFDEFNDVIRRLLSVTREGAKLVLRQHRIEELKRQKRTKKSKSVKLTRTKSKGEASDVESTDVEESLLSPFSGVAAETVESGTSRRTRIMLLCGLCVFLVIVLMVSFLWVGLSAMIETRFYASQISSAGRRRSLSTTVGYLAQELAWAGDSTQGNASSLVNTAVTNMDSMESIRCYLRTAAITLLATHRYLLHRRNGVDEILARFPSDPFDVSMSCSPITDDADLFEKSFSHDADFLALEEASVHLTYRPNCLSDLEWNHQELERFRNIDRFPSTVAELDPARCLLYKQDDAVGSRGLHFLIEFEAERALLLVQTDNSKISSSNADFQLIDRYVFGYADFKLGHEKAIITHVLSVLVDLEDSKVSLGLVSGFLLLFVIIQYFYLGRHIQNVMNENIAMGDVIRRFIFQLETIRQQRGRDSKSKR